MKITQQILDGFKSVEQFLNYFATIPDEKWCVDYYHRNLGQENEQHCARGHLCLNGQLGETVADNTLMKLAPDIYNVNNGYLTKGVVANRNVGIKDRVLDYLRLLLPTPTV